MTTDLITILPADVPYEDTLDNGCLLTDSDVHFLGTHMRPAISRKWIEDHKFNPINMAGAFSMHPHAAMKKIGIDWSLVIDAATYECPVLKQNYLSVVPIYLLTTDFLKYEYSNEFHGTEKDMMNDADWNHHWFSDTVQSSRFTDCLLGTGYTSGFRTHDGGNDYALASFKLSNGDYVIVKTFTWFNK